MDNTKRFTARAENYRKYRPDYPAAVIDVLKKKCSLNKDSVIADIGSGTGIFAKLLLPHVGMVYGVEPNSEMRKTAEELLASYGNFKSRDASAENTTLKTRSIDIVTAATAFHWFDKQKTKVEFKRILKDPKWVVLIWNERNWQNSEVESAYDAILNKCAPDYSNRAHKKIAGLSLEEWYEPGTSELLDFKNSQRMNWEGLQGRFLSSSYAPQPGDPNCARALDELRAMYDRFAREDSIILDYSTRLYVGKI